MKSNSMANKAYVYLKQLILSNLLPQFTRLKEEECAKQIGVSRIAVREALTRLLGEDLLVVGAKGGYYQKIFSDSEMSDLIELREIIETAAIRLAILRIEQHQLNELDKICDQFTEMANSEYFQGAHEADLKFHEKIVQFSANQKLLRAYQVSNIPLFDKRLGIPSPDPSEFRQTDLEHRAIIHALRLRNTALAEQRLLEHFTRGAALISKQDPFTSTSFI